MDTKNIIAAISLSAAVIILYSLFFAPPPPDPSPPNTSRHPYIGRARSNQLGHFDIAAQSDWGSGTFSSIEP